MYYKIAFYSSLVVGTLIASSSNTWIGMWMGLEINLLSIIPLMSKTKNTMASEAALKYFITQALASTLMLFAIINMSTNLMYSLQQPIYPSLMLNTSLLTKMGAAPFHFWFPEMIEGLTWNNSLIMMTWQKIAPMTLLMYSSFTTTYLFLSIIASTLISGIMGINQTSLRKIMAYSSINHIGWMIAAMMFWETIWMYYMLIYLIITLNIVLIFNKLHIFYMKQLFISMNQNPMIKMFFIMNFLSLGGLPPFLGFLPKWLTIQTLTMHGFNTIAILLVIMTLMTLYFYMKISLSTLTLNSNETTFYSTPEISKLWINSINFMTLSGLILSTLMFTLT